MTSQQEEIQLAMKRAAHMLHVAASNLEMGFYETAINRSYYAVFYAATAMLAAVGQTRAKHHGLYNAFSQYFIKPGIWSKEFADLYRRLMYDRENHDYLLSSAPTVANATIDLQNARRFVEQAVNWLTHEGWL